MNEKSYRRCKSLMIFFNILFLLAGLALLGVGIWIVVDSNSFQSITNLNSLLFVYASYIAIVIGGVTVLISFCGCVGAWKESKCLLLLFNFVLIVLVLAEVVALILAFVFTGEVETVLKEAGVASIKTQYGVNSPAGIAVTQAWDFTHVAAECCGLNDGMDFRGSLYDVNIVGDTLEQPWPITCCVRNGEGSYVDSTTCLESTNPGTTTNASKGCYDYLRNLLTTYAIAAGITAAVVLVVQILAISFGCCVASNISKHGKVGVW